jgi:hypothetical protein
VKTQYIKTHSRRTEQGTFYCKAYGYHRRVRTFGEIRANVGAFCDEELRDLKVYPRRCRSAKELDAWNDFGVTRNYKKSWKDFTKLRKQWMMGGEPVVDHCVWDDQPKWRKNQSSSGCPDLE